MVNSFAIQIQYVLSHMSSAQTTEIALDLPPAKHTHTTCAKLTRSKNDKPIENTYYREISKLRTMDPAPFSCESEDRPLKISA